ncbi:hypothetical protein WJX75_007134 [Coccomyxa subellipsoidea]|uniref:ARM repeat-containing protein n=1 Tax=Coccomyxa subellipsoidea TaxID=248742 RepID=A0ABR2YUG3_9CHLO
MSTCTVGLNTADESFPADAIYPMQELNLLVKEDDDEGALQAIATYSCAFRHPARLAYISGMGAAAEKAGFRASFEAFKQAVQVLPNALEPEVRCTFVSQLVPLAAAWDKDGGDEGHAEVVKLMQTALDSLEDDVEEVTSAGQAAVLGIARLLAPGELRVHVLGSLDALGRHQDDEMRCILAELLAALGAELEGIPVEADVLPRLLRLVGDSAYLVRKEVVFGLPRLAPKLSQQQLESQVMPAYRKLTKDRVWLVRAASASALPAIAGFLPAGEARAALIEVWQDLAGDTSKWVINSALTSLGPFLAQLSPESITDELLQRLCKAVEESTAGPDCLIAAAGALPAVAEAVGVHRWAALKPVLAALAASGNREVLHGLTHNLPRLARALGPDRGAFEWLPALEVMQQQGGAEALAGLAPQLAQFAALIPEERRAIVLQPLVAVLRGIASWRVRIELTEQLSELARCSPVQVVAESLVPTAVLLCQDPVAAVRHAAAADKTGTAHEATPALLPAEREPPDEPDQGQVGEVLSSLLRRLKTDLAHSRSFRSRHSFVVVCQHILGMQALELFQQELLPELLKLAQDPVVNVRLALCRLLLEDQGPLLRTLTSSAVSDPAEHIPVSLLAERGMLRDKAA